MSDTYLLIRNGYYFRPGGRGYTASKCEAGGFTKNAADEWCKSAEGVTMVLLEAADEVAPITIRGTVSNAQDAIDAKRYRYLRERDVNTIQHGGIFVGMTPDNCIVTEDDLDTAVDAAMSS